MIPPEPPFWRRAMFTPIEYVCALVFVGVAVFMIARYV